MFTISEEGSSRSLYLAADVQKGLAITILALAISPLRYLNYPIGKGYRLPSNKLLRNMFATACNSTWPEFVLAAQISSKMIPLNRAIAPISNQHRRTSQERITQLSQDLLTLLQQAELVQDTEHYGNTTLDAQEFHQSRSEEAPNLSFIDD